MIPTGPPAWIAFRLVLARHQQAPERGANTGRVERARMQHLDASGQVEGARAQELLAARPTARDEERGTARAQELGDSVVSGHRDDRTRLRDREVELGPEVVDSNVEAVRGGPQREHVVPGGISGPVTTSVVIGSGSSLIASRIAATTATPSAPPPVGTSRYGSSAWGAGSARGGET